MSVSSTDIFSNCCRTFIRCHTIYIYIGVQPMHLHISRNAFESTSLYLYSNTLTFHYLGIFFLYVYCPNRVGINPITPHSLLWREEGTQSFLKIHKSNELSLNIIKVITFKTNSANLYRSNELQSHIYIRYIRQLYQLLQRPVPCFIGVMNQSQIYLRY